MASFYNPGYNPYLQYGQPYQLQQAPQQRAASSSMIWVQGESGAKSYLLAPNETVPLWDSEAQTIYLKSADMNGMPSMKVLDYTIREQSNHVQNQLQGQPAQVDLSGYVKKEELGGYIAQFLRQMEGRGDGEKRALPATNAAAGPDGAAV